MTTPMRELAAALDVPYRPDDQGGFDHAAVLSLLDANGEIVFQQRRRRLRRKHCWTI